MSTQNKKTNLLEPDLPTAAQLLPYLERIDAARWYTNFGPLVCELEACLPALCFPGDEVALTTVNNGTAALELAVQALALPVGTRVALPTYSFPATLTAVLRNGLMPVFTDVDPVCWQLTPDMARELLVRDRIGLFMPVATFGNPVDAEGWAQLQRDTGVPVVVDAAAALGGQRVRSGPLFCFSMHATKPFACGEGGLVVAADPAMIARVRRLSNFGIRDFRVDALGTNAKMSEYHAAAGLAQVPRWQALVARRRELLASYRAALQGVCTFQQTAENFIPAVLSVRLPGPAMVTACEQALNASGYETRRWYSLPLHRIPGLDGRPLSTASTGFPVTEGLVAQCLGVPFHTRLDAETVAGIAACMRDTIRMGQC